MNRSSEVSQATRFYHKKLKHLHYDSAWFMHAFCKRLRANAFLGEAEMYYFTWLVLSDTLEINGLTELKGERKGKKGRKAKGKVSMNLPHRQITEIIDTEGKVIIFLLQALYHLLFQLNPQSFYFSFWRIQKKITLFSLFRHARPLSWPLLNKSTFSIFKFTSALRSHNQSLG